jgi:hypothetical protein
VIKFDNAAEAAGLAAQVAAYNGDGEAMARNMILGKIAPSFRTILGNSEGPLMELFSQFTTRTEKTPSQRVAGQPSRERAKPTSAVRPDANRLSQSSAKPSNAPAEHAEENKP